MPDPKADYNCVSFGKQTLLHLKPEDLSGKVFRGCGWSFEEPLTKVFPEGVTGLRFIGCRLDNISLPPGSVLDPDCSNYQYQVQPDGKDWAGTVEVDSKTAVQTFTPKAVVGTEAALIYKKDNVTVRISGGGK